MSSIAIGSRPRFSSTFVTAPPLPKGYSPCAVGFDLVEIPGFSTQLEEPGSHFKNLFSSAERRYCERSSNPAAAYAARWAAREAFFKAWSSTQFGCPPSLADDPRLFAQVEVISDAWSRPNLRLRDEVSEVFSATLPGAHSFLSLSHDGDYAAAVVMLASL
ncbi:holo-ACP synthase [Boudabousia marimammalium]|uniref:holo-ACP synthase AcpS n=1 Tax=Boudabousia marimammalium TaxID=156892 RepID=UPI000A03EAB4|nr:holo-ACP synthase [Boudabousia marimammalium]